MGEPSALPHNTYLDLSGLLLKAERVGRGGREGWKELR